MTFFVVVCYSQQCQIPWWALDKSTIQWTESLSQAGFWLITEVCHMFVCLSLLLLTDLNKRKQAQYITQTNSVAIPHTPDDDGDDGNDNWLEHAFLLFCWAFLFVLSNADHDWHEVHCIYYYYYCIYQHALNFYSMPSTKPSSARSAFFGALRVAIS